MPIYFWNVTYIYDGRIFTVSNDYRVSVYVGECEERDGEEHLDHDNTRRQQ